MPHEPRWKKFYMISPHVAQLKTVVHKAATATTVHCKNTWVPLTTFLGCLSFISVTKKCYKIGFLESHEYVLL